MNYEFRVLPLFSNLWPLFLLPFLFIKNTSPLVYLHSCIPVVVLPTNSRNFRPNWNRRLHHRFRHLDICCVWPVSGKGVGVSERENTIPDSGGRRATCYDSENRSSSIKFCRHRLRPGTAMYTRSFIAEHPFINSFHPISFEMPPREHPAVSKIQNHHLCVMIILGIPRLYHHHHHHPRSQI